MDRPAQARQLLAARFTAPTTTTVIRVKMLARLPTASDPLGIGLIIVAVPRKHDIAGAEATASRTERQLATPLAGDSLLNTPGSL